MKGIVQPSFSKVRTADTLWREKEREWEMKEAPEAPSGSPERGRALFAECSLLFFCSFSLLYGVCLIIFQILFYVLSLWNLTTSLPLLFRSVPFVFLEESVPFVFGRGSAFCLNHDGWMFFLSWIVYISNDVDREDVREFNTPWQSLRYTLG